MCKMDNRKFTEGSVIKGKDLKGCILCKILSEDMLMQGFQYKMGMNEDIKPLAMSGSCGAGLHFCLVKDVGRYLDYGNKLAVVSIPDEEDVYVDDRKFRTHRMVIETVMPFGETAAWEYLYEHRADITAFDNYAVRWAAESGYFEVVEYLYEHGADITADDNYAMKWAAENGHLEVVKYLHGHGADITADSNYALRWAALDGHLEVVKYLHEHGADLMAESSCALRWSAENGHLEVVKHLHENGADITADDNYAVRKAERNMHLDVAEYPKENMQ